MCRASQNAGEGRVLDVAAREWCNSTLVLATQNRELGGSM